MNDQQLYRLCGCLYADTEAEAQALQKLLRSLGGGTGWAIEHVTKNEDGSETTRRLA